MGITNTSGSNSVIPLRFAIVLAVMGSVGTMLLTVLAGLVVNFVIILPSLPSSEDIRRLEQTATRLETQITTLESNFGEIVITRAPWTRERDGVLTRIDRLERDQIDAENRMRIIEQIAFDLRSYNREQE